MWCLQQLLLSCGSIGLLRAGPVSAVAGLSLRVKSMLGIWAACLVDWPAGLILMLCLCFAGLPVLQGPAQCLPCCFAVGVITLFACHLVICTEGWYCLCAFPIKVIPLLSLAADASTAACSLVASCTPLLWYGDVCIASSTQKQSCGCFGVCTMHQRCPGFAAWSACTMVVHAGCTALALCACIMS